MNSVKSLGPEALYQRCDPQQFTFGTTADLEDLKEVLGQPRAVDAVQFGVGIRRDGYNLYCLGPTQVGKHAIVRHFLEQKAATEATPSDWCYINNFDQTEKPRTLRLPAGQGIELRDDVNHMIEELRSAIPSMFESENYRARKQVIEEEVKEQHEKVFEEIRRRAEEKGLALLRTPTGLVFAPMKNGKVLRPEEFEQLGEEESKQIEKDVSALQQELQTVMRQLPEWERKGREKLKELNREVTIFAVGHLIEELRKKYAEFPDVGTYLNAVQQDVIDNVAEFIGVSETPAAVMMSAAQPQLPRASAFFRRYMVNVIVNHKANHGAPVVYEDHPSYNNLVGQAEHMAQMGALVTDFNLIKPGALHRANGGFLLLDAHKVLLQPYSWEGLKRALRAGEIRIESLGQILGLASTVTLEPQPIPLNIKVVLLGERLLYYLLTQYDPDFNELFKVAVDFEDRVSRSPENSMLYARLIATLGRQERLLPMDRTAVSRIIEHSSRLAGDADKLSTFQVNLVDLLREADYWANQAGRTAVGAEDVQKAIDAQIRRVDRIRERLQEEVLRGTILIDTEGEKVGQINGLSVIQLGQFSFGRPSRITARVRLGKGEVVDIEREVELGGPIHSKGVLILSGFLGSRYATDRPLSLSASLVFEQSYSGIEGDSASSAELYSLLSALSEVPVKQSLAVTGSVNQHGQVQAIGGVNEKIEGFFDLCTARGLTGQQGVLIPGSNAKHLMLRQDVVEAVAAGKFHIYPVEMIDQGIEILTGVPAGERDKDGNFPEGTINARVEARLIALAERRVSIIRSTRTEGEA